MSNTTAFLRFRADPLSLPPRFAALRGLRRDDKDAFDCRDDEDDVAFEGSEDIDGVVGGEECVDD